MAQRSQDKEMAHNQGLHVASICVTGFTFWNHLSYLPCRIEEVEAKRPNAKLAVSMDMTGPDPATCEHKGQR